MFYERFVSTAYFIPKIPLSPVEDLPQIVKPYYIVTHT